MAKTVRLCEHCGEPLDLSDPDSQPWRIRDRLGVIRWFCSYLCQLRWCHSTYKPRK